MVFMVPRAVKDKPSYRLSLFIIVFGGCLFVATSSFALGFCLVWILLH